MIELEGLEPAEPGSKEGDYQIAPNINNDDGTLYGWIWTLRPDGIGMMWDMRESTNYSFRRGVRNPNGANGDMTYADKPNDMGSLTWYNETIGTSDEALYGEMRRSLCLGTYLVNSDIGLALARHFLSGNGETLIWNNESIVSRELSQDPPESQRLRFAASFAAAQLNFKENNAIPNR